MLNITNYSRNASQNYNEIFHTNYNGYYFLKRKKRTSVGEDVGKLEPLCITGENIKWYSSYGKQNDIFSKIKHRITI